MRQGGIVGHGSGDFEYTVKVGSWRCFQNTLEIGTTRGDSDLGVQFYGVAYQVQSWRNLASTHVLHFCHALVPNFGDQSIRVWLKFLHQEKIRT